MRQTAMTLMKTSLVGRELSTRLRNVLINMAAYSTAQTWEQLVEGYRSDPDEMDAMILRTPGAGRACVNELRRVIEPELRGVSRHGDTVFLGPEDVQQVMDTIDEACTHCPESLCNDLKTIRAFFTASTIRTRLPGG